jgi:hypothetical protein
MYYEALAGERVMKDLDLELEWINMERRYDGHLTFERLSESWRYIMRRKDWRNAIITL